ncbi:YhcN/YlaJ family sporulation lipoprotein [Bacillus sp. ISL-40]|uniref:YhcN/YlaJ family sporulation lipoprotein n=1 Tax=unclassified Bacillus (in: firmicutes) TaxID=185979 RepID=UPI001BE8B86E|nr:MULTISPECIES: YhcN/YlaJ family sporulation lipoprotein [unclassified Bacillus (in: firmicutes)]MBT2697686.1 YhcN/YlaJ family sporulation lipoprotein [Bacillus sp. ISL-40]MBT2722511.1 YhcN/YlaJ family sporulation lipoprotein [Bacillus sp. ISL-46]MBT2742326.1 YhcN/YlaJ family sporulation lipoprotein [Bacillus sp. ISL-77]
MKKTLIITALCLILAGCSTKRELTNNENASYVKVKNSYIESVDRKTGQEISKRLVKLATSIPNVNDATAVVLGRYAMVGIDVNAKIDRSQVGSIKYSVAESLKKDPYGAKAVVVADADTTQRLKEIQTDINKGRPIQGIMEELADVAGRLMPEIPGDLITPSPKNATEKPDKKLPEKDKKKLEKEQEDQSNHYK